MRFGEKLKNYYGSFILVLVSLIALVKLLKQELPGHYRIFTGAGEMLWRKENPYGHEFGFVGYWFYSPTCGMLFFKPFALLPEWLGLSLYMTLSTLLLFFGLQKWASILSHENQLNRKDQNHVLQLCYFLLTPALYSAILASKLEIFMVGTLFCVSAWLIQERKLVVSALVMALLLNWKFQPLPTVGLIALSLLLIDRSVRWIGWVGVFLVGWFAWPILYLGSENFLAYHSAWSQTLSHFVSTAWPIFENVFAFGSKHFGFPYEYRQTQVMSLIFGMFLAGLLAYRLFKTQMKASEKKQHLKVDAIDYALIGGALFAVGFSPLSQNNAMILLAPIFLYLAFQLKNPTTTRLAKVGMWFFWLFMAFAYSDLIPKPLQLWLREMHLKSFVLLVLGTWIAMRKVSKIGLLSTRGVHG